MDPTKFKLQYSHKWIDHPLQIITKINDRIINIDVSGKNEIIIDKTIKLDKGKHILSLEINGKNEANTSVDAQGNIVIDTLVTIKSLMIDEIEILPLMYNASYLQTFYINNSPDECLHKLTEIGYNGTWEFKIETPLYDWLLNILF